MAEAIFSGSHWSVTLEGCVTMPEGDREQGADRCELSFYSYIFLSCFSAGWFVFNDCLKTYVLSRKSVLNSAFHFFSLSQF